MCGNRVKKPIIFCQTEALILSNFPSETTLWDFPSSPEVGHFKSEFYLDECCTWGPEELVWECLDAVQCECEFQVVPSDTGRDDMRARKRSIDDRFHSVSSVGAELTFSHPLWEWQLLIADCSTRKFTKYTDRLIALESTANKFTRLDKGPYHYGLWADILPLQLEWDAQQNTRRLDLPTWSWASILTNCYYNAFPFLPATQVSSVREVLELPAGPCSETGIVSRSLVIP